MLREDMYLYVVVAFDDSLEVEVIPTSWLNTEDSTCKWPTFTDSGKIRRPVQTCLKPEIDWLTYPARVLHWTSELKKN